MGDLDKPIDTGTALALKRSVLAAERTLMAWIRTALSMIDFGFTMVKFFQFLESSRGVPTRGIFGRTWAPEVVGLAMMSIGTVSLILAVVVHWNEMKALRGKGSEKKWSLALLVAALVSVLGVFALVTILWGEMGLGGGVTAGADPGSPVNKLYKPPFAFTGTPHSVVVDVSGDLIEDKASAMRMVMARQ